MSSSESESRNVRLIHSGEYEDGLFHLVDLNLYDSSIFGNACIFQANEDLIIFDAGTSENVNQIVNHIDFHELKTRKIYIVLSHHHFDHSGGVLPLITHFEKNHVPVKLVTTTLMAARLRNISKHVDGARKQFKKMLGTVKRIPNQYVISMRPGSRFVIDMDHVIELLPTPGHCPDHVSPVVYKRGKPVLCYLGEALGINLRKHLSPLPACVAPDFSRVEYVASIKKIRSLEPEIGIFGHVGGVRGIENVISTCDLALTKLDEVTKYIKTSMHEKRLSTSQLVEVMKNKYKEYIATCVMDDEIVDNLSFLLVYGLLKDLGYK